MARNPEDEAFLKLREAIAPEAEPPVVLQGPETKYNTALSPVEEAQFKDWLAKQSAARGRDASRDLVDYDLRGQFKTNPTADSGHMPDTFKKPNHPTFSDESQYSGAPGAYKGGHWDDKGFTPSVDMLANGHDPLELSNYMKEAEPGVHLNLPPEASSLGVMPTPTFDATPPLPAPTPLPVHGDPYGKGADRAALEAAIHDRNNSDAASSFLDAATLFNKAGGGSAGDLAASTRAHRDDSFNDVMRRRALTDQDALAAKKQKEADLDVAMRDPGSDVSVHARNLFGGTTVGRALRSRMGDQFDLLSASQLPGARDIVNSETDLLKTELKAGNGTNDGRSGALDALVAAAGGDESDRGKFFRGAFKEAPLKVIKDQGFNLLNTEEKHKFDEHMQGIRDTEAEKRARIMAGQSLEKELRADRSEMGGKIEKTGSFFPNAAVVDSILAKNTDKDGKIKQLPAIGPLAKPLTDFWGGALRSEEGTKLAKAADQIQLAYRNLVTGSAASTEEDRRINLAGLDRRNLQSFVTGFQAMKNQYKDLLQRTYGLYEPQVAQGFIARTPQYGIPGDPVYDPAVAKKAYKHFEDASRTKQLMPGIEHLEQQLSGSGAAPSVSTSTPVREPSGAPAQLRFQGKLYQEDENGDAVEVPE